MSIDEREAGEMDRVVPLNQLSGYAVADDDPDVRGWHVMSADGSDIGRVDQLLVDREAMKVRYLDVDLNDALAGGHHALIPIGYARLDPAAGQVFVDGLSATQIAALPAYGHALVTRDMEQEFQRPFAGMSRSADGERETRVVRHEEELVTGRRRTDAGEVQINKRVETEHVSRPVQLAHDEVTVERRPVTERDMAAAPSGEASIEAGEIRVPLSAEKAVLEKRVVPKEELIVRTREVQESEVVEADLRRERIDVKREGDARRDPR